MPPSGRFGTALVSAGHFRVTEPVSLADFRSTLPPSGKSAADFRYAELAVTTNYSFLRGGSHPRQYVEQAAHLGYAAIGIADRNSLAGVVRAYEAWQRLDDE